jgi:hydroxypyruvate reductase
MTVEPVALLRRLFDAAVTAAMPGRQLTLALPAPPRGRTLVVGAGKAAAAMAKVVEDAWAGPLEGLAVTRYGHGLPTRTIEVVEAGHPLPDAAGEQAAARMLAAAQALGSDDLLLGLFSGGGSALLVLPAPGLTLDEKQAVTRDLLRCGASIAEFNCVRKHLSAIKGGRLAAVAAPAEVMSLLISDVPGDDPAVIASGPTVADPTTFADARAVIAKYRLELPARVRAHLEQAVDDTPKPGDPRLARSRATVIATPQDALEAAAAAARAAGYAPLILANAIEGEARDIGLAHGAIARQVALYGQPVPPPCVILSGGETQVTIRGSGHGGRNTEFLLSFLIAAEGHPRIWAIACDTDGIDGFDDHAGAIATPSSLARAQAQGLDARALLADNDSGTFFAALGDLLVTGPTRTNVNDFRAVLITGAD